MPMSDITVKDTWNVSGLRGTGSNTAFADKVYVPKSQVMLLPDRLVSEANPNAADDPVYRIPFAAMFGLALMGTCLGAADAAAEYISEKAPQRGVTYFEFDKQIDSGALLEKLGEAKMKIETAWLHVRRGAALLDDATIHGEVSYRDRARCRADAVHAAESVRSAMDMLLNIGSSSSFAESNPLQRYWRDINVGSRHAFLNSAPVYEAYSRADLGIEPNVTIYI
jgi:alkylation response protein AidB-like acyl-CoA dehydrogenase